MAEWRRIERGAATMEFSLAIGKPLLAPHSPVTVSGYKSDIDAIEWLAIKVHHSMEKSGFTARVEMENASADASVSAIKEVN